MATALHEVPDFNARVRWNPQSDGDASAGC
jgi:hypothetical protein